MVLEEFDEKKLEELAKGLPEFGRFGKELETIGVLPIPSRLRRYRSYNLFNILGDGIRISRDTSCWLPTL
ncbi:hypothetical protein [Vulcanisaeta moutnovskia]|uniref:hypothetical protein n=1 Tax=Vulcanisaeta moutnovskia TaxID=985052 RepID=UPI000AED3119|nr:hypothetical protein [Vulcanisaeta moutnovskia]